ncbi:dirigent protein [Streptomyces cynarae]|uniref:Dirigent protein n=1 Tax=Streptomyces cynarae TaxID=2981134 RepID=A0ABY6E4U1_9ACTN|nr:dirigent protein [Streptomyces cynarae]UXY21615.1 dirigent protein [Streptomyces cynarae]
MQPIKRRSLGVAVGTAIAFACASPATAAGSSGPGVPREEVFQLVARSTQTSSVDVNPSGPSQGDEFVISGELLNQGATVGTYGEVCTLTRVGPVDHFDLQCVASFTLAQGQITVQGRFSVTPAGSGEVDLAITGGTGLYRTAGGYVHAVNISSTDTQVTVHLTR